MTVDPVEAAYKQGQLDQRLAGFDQHFAVVNGSIEKTASQLSTLSLAIEGLRHTLDTRLTASDLVMVRRDGPIVEQLANLERRFDLLDAKNGGSLRLWAAAGSSFAVAVGVVLLILHAAGLT